MPWPRKGLALRCWLALNFTAMALRIFSLGKILDFFGTNTAITSSRSQFSKSEIIWTVRAAAALCWRPTCAVRALVAEQLLRRNGHAALFKVGVTSDSNFQAHAWVEDESGILVGESDHSYQPLPDIAIRNVSSS